MKTLLVLLLTLSAFTFARAQDEGVTLSVCQYADGVYQFSFTGQVDSYGFTNASSYDLDAMTASGEGVAFTVWYAGATQTIYGYPDAPPCDEAGWQPGAPSIYVPLTSDCAYVEIDNHDGGWSRVEIEGAPLLLHYGQALIGSNRESTNPVDYRAVPIPCY